MQCKRARIVLAVAAMAGPLFAQHEEHNHANSPQPGASELAKAPAQSDMMADMPQMMARHGEIKRLVDQLVQNVAAMQAETDPAAIKRLLDAHAAQLKELQAKLLAGDHMQGMMQKMMGNATPAKAPDAAAPPEHQH